MTAEAPALAHPHAEDPAVVAGRQRLGVILLIAADVAFVLSLVFTYSYLRGLNTSGNWIPDGGRTVGMGLGWVIAGVVVISLLAYRWAENGIRAGDSGRLTVGLLLALVLILVDLGLQLYQLGTSHLVTTDGSYASSFIALGGYHVVHLLLTAFLGIGVWNRARKGMFTAGGHAHVHVIGLWWVWVTVSALITALTTSFT
jgi:heme/copper-type cytochrome/quinol oxidase subunit 3